MTEVFAGIKEEHTMLFPAIPRHHPSKAEYRYVHCLLIWNKGVALRPPQLQDIIIFHWVSLSSVTSEKLYQPCCIRLSQCSV